MAMRSSTILHALRWAPGLLVSTVFVLAAAPALPITAQCVAGWTGLGVRPQARGSTAPLCSMRRLRRPPESRRVQPMERLRAGPEDRRPQVGSPPRALSTDHG